MWNISKLMKYVMTYIIALLIMIIITQVLNQHTLFEFDFEFDFDCRKNIDVIFNFFVKKIKDSLVYLKTNDHILRCLIERI